MKKKGDKKFSNSSNKPKMHQNRECFFATFGYSWQPWKSSKLFSSSGWTHHVSFVAKPSQWMLSPANCSEYFQFACCEAHLEYHPIYEVSVVPSRYHGRLSSCVSPWSRLCTQEHVLCKLPKFLAMCAYASIDLISCSFSYEEKLICPCLGCPYLKSIMQRCSMISSSKTGIKSLYLHKITLQ